MLFDTMEQKLLCIPDWTQVVAQETLINSPHFFRYGVELLLSRDFFNYLPTCQDREGMILALLHRQILNLQLIEYLG